MKHKSQTNYINLLKSKTRHLKKRNHTLETFIDLVQNDINEIKTKKLKSPKSSLSNGKQDTMKHLAKRRDIIITMGDKGGAVVITNTENYIKEPSRELSDKNNY